MELDRRLGGSKLDTSEAGRTAHARDDSEAVGRIPDAVVVASSRDDIRATLEIAERFQIPVTPRAAGTGRTGPGPGPGPEAPSSSSTDTDDMAAPPAVGTAAVRSYPTTYFPGVAAADATPVAVEIEQLRDGVDFALRPVTSAAR